MRNMAKISIFFASFVVGACVDGNTNYRSEQASIQSIQPLYQQADRRVTTYESWDIPENPQAQPNYATLRHYLRRHQNDPNKFDRYSVSPARTPLAFKRNLRESSFLKQQMLTTGILSYLYLENDVLIHDELTPPEMFGDMISNNTPLRGNSVGKSMMSYVLGHAICAGYIDGVDARLSDWPVLEGTLYHNQRIVDLLNMRAGDELFVTERDGLRSSGRWFNNYAVLRFARSELAGSQPRGNEGSRQYNYNGLVTNILLNYIKFKSGSNFERLLNDVFQRNARIGATVHFTRLRGYGRYDGAAWYSFYASRNDYLRIARAMMADWQNRTCVGEYLRTVQKRAQSKNERAHRDVRFDTRSYGGQFHFEYSGMGGRNIFGMDGYGGQSILIDMDNSRIVVVNSITQNYNWRELVHQVIQRGSLRQ
jgi:hypothetical protein